MKCKRTSLPWLAMFRSTSPRGGSRSEARASSRHSNARGQSSSQEQAYGQSPLRLLRQAQRGAGQPSLASLEQQRVAALRHAAVQAHYERLAKGSPVAATPAPPSPRSAKRWADRHRRQAKVAVSLITGPFFASPLERAVASRASLQSRGSTAVVELLDGGLAATHVPPAHSTKRSTLRVETASVSSHHAEHAPLSPLSSREDEVVQSLSPPALPEPEATPAPPASHTPRPSTAPKSAQGRPPVDLPSWARVSYRRPRSLSSGRGSLVGVLWNPTPEQSEGMLMQGRKVLAGYCVIPDPPEVTLPLPPPSGDDGPGTPHGAVTLNLVEMYPAFDRVNVVANRVLGLAHLGGDFPKYFNASHLRALRQALCHELVVRFPFLAQGKRTGRGSAAGPHVAAECTRRQVQVRSAPVLSLLPRPDEDARLYQTPFKGVVTLPTGDEVVAYMPRLHGAEVPFPLQARHILRRDAGFGGGFAWGPLPLPDLVSFIAKAGGRSPDYAHVDVPGLMLQDSAGLPGTAEATPSPDTTFSALCRVAPQLQGAGVGFLAGLPTPYVAEAFWSGVEERTRAELAQSLLQWSMAVPLPTSPTGSRAVTGLGFERGASQAAEASVSAATPLAAPPSSKGSAQSGSHGALSAAQESPTPSPPASGRSTTAGSGRQSVGSDTMEAAGALKAAMEAMGSDTMASSQAGGSQLRSSAAAEAAASDASAQSTGDSSQEEAEASLGLPSSVPSTSPADAARTALANLLALHLVHCARGVQSCTIGPPSLRESAKAALSQDARHRMGALLDAVEGELQWRPPEGDPPSKWPAEYREAYLQAKPRIMQARDEVYMRSRAAWQAALGERMARLQEKTGDDA